MLIKDNSMKKFSINKHIKFIFGALLALSTSIVLGYLSIYLSGITATANGKLVEFVIGILCISSLILSIVIGVITIGLLFGTLVKYYEKYIKE